MGTIWLDVRHAFRVLLKSPGFTAVALVALALGIGANTAIFSVVRAVLLRPLPFSEPEQLVWIQEDAADVQNRWVSYPNFADWRARNHSFAAMSTTRTWALTLTGGGEPESLDARMVSADFFDVVRVRPFLGRAFLREEDRYGAPAVTILSYGFWQRRFGGDQNIVGKTITLDDRPFTVVGVMPRDFQYQGPPPAWVLVGQWAGEGGWLKRDVRVAGYVIGRLKPGVTIRQAQADMDAIKADLTREQAWSNAGHGIRIRSLYEQTVGESRRPLLLLFGAVAFVLLIACANVANLMLARATARRREFAVRAALGASRWRLVRQLLAESVLLSALGGALGLLLALWGVELLRGAGGAGIPRADAVGVDRLVLCFTCALSALTGVAFGSAPAWAASKADLSEALKDGARASAGGAGRRLRAALVVSEIAVALVLLVGAGLLTRSLARLLTTDPGFDPDNVLTMSFSLPKSRYADKQQINSFQRELLSRVAQLPGVRAACLSNSLPGLASWQNDIAVEGRAPLSPGEEINVDWGITSERYFDVMGIPILRGRSFTPEEARAGARVVLVDENLARRFWPDGDAVGKRIRHSPEPDEIIGVVGNVKDFGQEGAGRIHIYSPAGDAALRRSTLSIRLDAPGAQAVVAAAVAREAHALDKDLPLTDVETVAQILGREAAPRKFNAALLGLFAALALALAAVGIYGVMSYAVAQRTPEIGVRMALGAQTGDVLRLIVSQGLRLTLAGIALGLLSALAVTRVLASLLYGVSARDPLVFACGSLLLASVAVLACYLPARRAAKVDPLVALRYE